MRLMSPADLGLHHEADLRSLDELLEHVHERIRGGQLQQGRGPEVILWRAGCPLSLSLEEAQQVRDALARQLGRAE
jgi:hypothetical protein